MIKNRGNPWPRRQLYTLPAMAVMLVVSAVSMCCAQPATSPTTQAADPLIGHVTDWFSNPSNTVGNLASADWAFQPLDRDQAQAIRAILAKDFCDQIRREDRDAYANNEVNAGGETLKLLKRHFGAKPAGGWPLFISLHGGGNATAALNDQEWHNQITLYRLDNAFFIAPRAPGNTWDLWHEAHIDPLLDRLITDAIALDDVDPNRVYLMGYSAGGDGVYQLAPRMADRFAAASMMAGHPNESKPDGLRNIPFAIHVGALDDGYGRNKVAAEWKVKLDALHAADPEGYIHDVQLHPGRAHWMNLEDRSAVPWMAAFTRDTLPRKVVWLQGNVTHDRLYWLAVPENTAKRGQLIVASRSGQTITIEKAVNVASVTVLLSDAMLNLDQPITVQFDGKPLFHGIVRRTVAEESQTLAERGDPSNVFDADITVQIPADVPPRAAVDSNELQRAFSYLRANMPERDRKNLDDVFLENHAAAALVARDQSPWMKDVPDELFLEYVLPYSSVDETREPWRSVLTPLANQIVAGVKSPGEAAKKLNAELFGKIHVSYNATRRPFPNQSPAESMACGYASCTGLSILLIDACRAVNIPARLVGIASWVAPNGPTYAGGGNHAWVEIWDGRQWRFLGAAERSDLDKTWFVDSASRSLANSMIHSIFASAFAPATDHFVMVWNPVDATVPAVNVTRFYTSRSTIHVNGPAHCHVEIRLAGRIVAAGDPGDFVLARGERYTVRMLDADGQKITPHDSELNP